MLFEAGLEVSVRLVGFLQAGGGEKRVLPVGSTVTGEYRPVALVYGLVSTPVWKGFWATYVPSRTAVVAFSSVVPALAVTSHNKDLVAGLVRVGIAVEILDILSKSLPLGLRLQGLAVLGVRGIGAVQETKIPLSLGIVSIDYRKLLRYTYVVKRRGVCSWVVLHENLGDRSVLDLLALGRMPVGKGTRGKGD